MVLEEAKSLYQVVWWGEDHYPCSRFVSAVEAGEARDLVRNEVTERGQVANNILAIRIHDVDGYEVRLTETTQVGTHVDPYDGSKMPHCEACGYGLCFDDVFCGKCGNRLDWEVFWQ